MTNEMRLKLAREPFEKKLQKVAQLIRLTKSIRRRGSSVTAKRTSGVAES